MAIRWPSTRRVSNGSAEHSASWTTKFGKLRSLEWTKPGTGKVRSEFAYDAFHERVQKIAASGGHPTVTYIGGLFEVRSVDGLPDEHVIIFPQGAGQRSLRYDKSTQMAELRPSAYFHCDGQGSLIATTDEDGQVVEQMSYDAYGRHRNMDQSYANQFYSPTLPYTKVGYTGHQNDDEAFLVNAGGERTYDPYLKRFLQRDSIVADLYNGSNWNLYAYVNGNPLRYTDPSGHEGECSGASCACQGGQRSSPFEFARDGNDRSWRSWLFDLSPLSVPSLAGPTAVRAPWVPNYNPGYGIGSGDHGQVSVFERLGPAAEQVDRSRCAGGSTRSPICDLRLEWTPRS